MCQKWGTDGTVKIQIVCADCSGMMRKLGVRGILLWEVRCLDYLTVQFACAAKDVRNIKEIAAKTGAEVIIRNESPLQIAVRHLIKRPLMILSFMLLTVLVLYVPTRVLFIRIEGNTNIPTKRILEQAEICGIDFGASRRLVRSEKVKNALLDAIPELQWAGVNTSGCVATISVREKTKDTDEEPLAGIGNIVADIDGVIQNCTVQNGTALCKVGDAVTPGQILVSGYTDCGIAIKSVRAKAEITAITIHKLQLVTPSSICQRGTVVRQERRFSLRIGKKIINFFKDSGISDTSCVKMYTEEYLTLPGGFQLPVSFIIQTCTYYTEPVKTETSTDWILAYSKRYLLDHLQAGQVLREHIQTEYGSGLYCMYNEYICLENIGQFVNEEIVKHDGQTN